ncbi:MAG: MFS transporter [Chloroflexi bacterium]|nr:MFS transporter [Chloroflexota bacterium]
MKNRQRIYILVATTIGAFITPFMGSSINIALPLMGTEMNMNAILLGWIATAYLIASATLVIPFGRLADIVGRKKIFLLGTLIYSIASLLCAISTSPAMLIIFRIFQGVGGAMNFSNSIAILTSVYPAKDKGMVLGINVASVYAGLSVGPFVGGFLTEHFGWRSIFIVNIPLGVIVIALVLWKVKGDWAKAKGEKFDFIGSSLYCVALVALIYGFSLLPAMSGAWLILGSIILLAFFLVLETKIKSPVLEIKLFKNNAAFTFSNIAALISYSSTFAVAFLLSLYLQYIKGYSPEKAGLILIAQPVIMAVFSPFTGKLSDRIEPRILASIGMVLTTAGLIILIFLTNTTGIPLIIFSMILLGFGYAFFSTPNTNAVMSSVHESFYGIASAIISTMRQVGMMLSMGITMLLFALFIGKVEITPEFYPDFLQSFKVAFIIFSVLCFIGIIASLARGNIGRAKPVKKDSTWN